MFAFLAFLVALVNILMNNGRKRRRKREANSESDYVRNLKVAPSNLTVKLNTTHQACEVNPHEIQQGINATHSLLEGYMKALGSETPECSAFHLCEAGFATAGLGPVGRSFAKVAR